MTEAREQLRGLQVMAILAALTVGEYILAISIDSSRVLVALLAGVAVVKAWLIATYFMHVYRLWRGEGSH